MTSIPDPSSATVADDLAPRRSRRRRPPGDDGRFARTDAGNGELLARLNAGDVRYVSDLGIWIVYDREAGYWVRDDDLSRMIRRAVDMVRVLFRNAAEADGTERNEQGQHAVKSGALPRLTAAIQIAATVDTIRVRASDLDPDPALYGVPNGTVDLHTGELHDHDPADLITHQSPVRYNPDAKAPRWERFLTEVQPDPAVRDYLQRLLGYCLTGTAVQQEVYFFHGTGANGKSKLLEVLVRIMGDYAQIAPGDLLLASNNEPASGAPHPELVRMQGKRFTKCLETDEGRRLAESRMKQLTGEDQVAARTLHSRTLLEFYPVAKIIVATNHLPRIKSQDNANRRRIVVVPFTQTFSKDDGTAELDLTDVLMAESEGIQAWLIEGARKYYEQGLIRPAAIIRATDEYFEENDPVGEWIANECWTRDRAASESATVLYNNYLEWTRKNGYQKPLTSTMFGRKLTERGYDKLKGDRLVFRIGIRLRRGSDDDELDPAPAVKAEPCQVCGEPLPAWVTDEGHNTHPGCEPVPTLPTGREDDQRS